MIDFEDQNELFGSSDVSDDTKKFVTFINKLIINGLLTKVTKSQKYMFSYFVQRQTLIVQR